MKPSANLICVKCVSPPTPTPPLPSSHSGARPSKLAPLGQLGAHSLPSAPTLRQARPAIRRAGIIIIIIIRPPGSNWAAARRLASLAGEELQNNDDRRGAKRAQKLLCAPSEPGQLGAPTEHSIGHAAGVCGPQALLQTRREWPPAARGRLRWTGAVCLRAQVANQSVCFVALSLAEAFGLAPGNTFGHAIQLGNILTLIFNRLQIICTLPLVHTGTPARQRPQLRCY